MLLHLILFILCLFSLIFLSSPILFISAETVLDDVLSKILQTNACARKQVESVSKSYNEEMQEKINKHWEHENFLKSRRWDPASNQQDGEELVPLSPSEIQRKLKGEFDVEHRQTSRDEMLMKQLHQLKLKEKEDAKEDCQNRARI